MTTTTFYLETTNGTEAKITVTGEFIEGARAATDEYGRPTECDTCDEWEIGSVEIDGKIADITDEFCCEFLVYDGRARHSRTMKAAEFENAIIDALNFERDFRSQALPF